MTDVAADTPINTEKDGDKVANEETENEQDEKEATNQPKQRSVSFNKDVHVKRFGKPREARGASTDRQPPAVRKEPFTHLSEKELIAEANKVIEQAGSVTCTADHPPEKFFSLPHRRKFKQEQDRSLGRRNSDDVPNSQKSLGRSTSDVGTKKKIKERTSLSTLFRRTQRNKSPESPIVITTKPVAVVKRSKSDVSDLKSNTNLSSQPKPIRKRSGSETEEFLKSLRNKKSQLSPIIESSPREDYFKKTPPLEKFQKQKLSYKDSVNSEDQNLSSENKKVNPIEKPPRYKTPEKQIEPKPPVRTKRGKSSEKDSKEKSPSITETPKRKTGIKKTLLVDEIDSVRGKDINPVEVKERIKDSIKKIQENIYGEKEMIHSSQQPPDKPPLTRGHTVDHIVRILKEDQMSPPPKSHLITPTSYGSNINQPFSYTKPSVSPDPNLYMRGTSPDRVPVNKMNSDKGIVYAQVVRGDQGDSPSNNISKQTVHKTYSPSRERFGHISDEDEGLGYEDQKTKFNRSSNYNKSNDNDTFNGLGAYKITDSPIRPKFREYKLTSFDDFEPTYANEYPVKEECGRDFVDTALRGRGDGMDSKRKIFTDTEIKKVDLDFNALSHRRQLLESRLNARKYERERVPQGETVTRYVTETDPIYEAEKRMKATEKYVNETAKYYRHTLERDGYTENSITESYNKYDNDSQKIKYNTEFKTFERSPKEIDRKDFIDGLPSKEPTRFIDNRKVYPPEPEYEPPSLEIATKNTMLTPDEYNEKKYKIRNRHITSSQDTLQTGQKYSKGKDSWFGKRKGHYASNPEIAQEREEDYVNSSYDPKHKTSYHNSLRRDKHRDRREEHHKDYLIKRHDSGDSRDYVYRDDRSPRRFDFDNRLVDSGIENDFRKDSTGDIHRSNMRYRIPDSDDEARDTSLFLANERRHTEDNYPSEQIYANGEYHARFEDFNREDYHREKYLPRERSADDGTHFDPRVDRFDKSPTRYNDKNSAKPPKAAKKLSGLEKVKQLFSRDSSKKSKKEKEPVQMKPRTRVLKSPEHLARRDSDYRRYKDPEPSDEESRRRDKDYPKGGDILERRYRNSDPGDSDIEKRYRPEPIEQYNKHFRETEEERRRYETEIREEKRREERNRSERKETIRYTGSSDRESEHKSPRNSDVEHQQSKSRETSRKSRSMTADSLDSPALAERYRGRRRLATPSPTPSPPRREHPQPPQPTSAGNWFKSLDRLARKRTKNTKTQKESGAATEDETVTRKSWSKPINSPAKNLRFFGDTDQDSDSNTKQTTSKSKGHPQKHSTLRKTISNSSTGIDELDHSEMSHKSHSLTNLQRGESPKPKSYYKRNLHNISEIHSNSENESQFDRKMDRKPPKSPYDRRSRSHSSSKVVKDVKKNGSRSELRGDERGSSSELRGSKQELSREMKHRRRTPATNSGESSTEGDSSHQSQRSIVYLHATTVGDIPDPGRLGKNRSRDDVSSVNSSSFQARTTSKSFSIFAPWTPRHYGEPHDVHYAQKPRRQSKPREIASNTLKSTKNKEERPSTLQKNKSYSQTTLARRPQNHRLTSSSTTLYRKPEKRSSKENLSAKNVKETKKSQSTEVLRDGDRERISRSISMPKDNNKKAGWFKISNKNKKPEVNTRVR